PLTGPAETPLRDRVALVTGAGRGIGRALALGLADAGARVIGVARTEAEVTAVANDIRSRGGQAEARRCDVANAGEVGELMNWVDQQFGQLDVMVNNAALRMIHVGSPTSYFTPAEELTIEEWDRMLAVNLRGPFLTSKLALPLLRKAGSASVINISSGGGTSAQAGRTPYCVSKFGLEALTQCLAAEWQADNIAVNSLAPGVSVLTDAIKLDMRRENPSLRHARPEMMVPPLLFLAQAQAAQITGQRIVAWEWLQTHGLGAWDRWAA
ncbi:MAG: SDR family NAD(P)-dependent oxidoreductase, partial [Chloroflexota bacterium]